MKDQNLLKDGYFLDLATLRGMHLILLIFSIGGATIRLYTTYDELGLHIPPAFTLVAAICLVGVMFPNRALSATKLLVYSLIPIAVVRFYTSEPYGILYSTMCVVLPHLLVRQREAWALSLIAAVTPLVFLQRQDVSIEWINRLILINLAVSFTFGYVMNRFRIVYKKVSAMAEEAEQANSYKNTILSNISHEIRTPLNAIFGSLQLIDSHYQEPDTVNKFSKIAMQSYDSVIEILNDILDVAKLSQGKIDLVLEVTKIHEIVELIFSELNVVAQEKGLTLESRVSEEILASNRLADRSRVTQILRNLVSNAVKFTTSGIVCVDVRLGAKPDEVIFTVRDTGVGIPKEKLRLIFEPFEQVDSSRNIERSGSGLGLAITSLLVDLMRGKIEVESTVGVGTTFEVTLELPTTDLPIPEMIPRYDLTSLVPARILLAEDVVTNRLIFTALLKDCPYSIDEAENGKIAVEKALAGDYDIVFLDIKMPVMDGLTALQILKSERYTKPILACTANVMKEDVERHLKSGFKKIVSKPFLKEQLIATIQSEVSTREKSNG
jgi:signal transduction histidine kinase/CheY-like chemotaxis protein